MSQDTIQAPELQRQLSHPSHPQTPLVVDLRNRRQYRRQHIPGSHHMSPGRLISTEFPDQDLVLVGRDEHNTSRLIAELYDQGYPRRIQQLQGGLNEWRAAGLPLEGQDLEQRKNRNPSIPWITLAAGTSLLLGLQQISPAFLLIGLVLLLTPPLIAGWLQRNLFKLERRAS